MFGVSDTKPSKSLTVEEISSDRKQIDYERCNEWEIKLPHFLLIKFSLFLKKSLKFKLLLNIGNCLAIINAQIPS
jgi:hypothetical protein